LKTSHKRVTCQTAEKPLFLLCRNVNENATDCRNRRESASLEICSPAMTRHRLRANRRIRVLFKWLNRPQGSRVHFSTSALLGINFPLTRKRRKQHQRMFPDRNVDKRRLHKTAVFKEEEQKEKERKKKKETEREREREREKEREGTSTVISTHSRGRTLP